MRVGNRTGSGPELEGYSADLVVLKLCIDLGSLVPVLGLTWGPLEHPRRPTGRSSQRRIFSRPRFSVEKLRKMSYDRYRF